MKKGIDPTVEIIAVGAELLTPLFQDTNSLYLIERLNQLGLQVSFKTIVGDDWDDLRLCLKQSFSRTELLIAMGGLGPTEDDRTREALASVLGKRLILDRDVLEKIRARFERRGLQMPSLNKKQAYIIEGSELLENKNGTAPGLWLKSGGKIVVLLPGPPHELKPMFEVSVWPRLQSLRRGYRASRVLKITGLTESQMESLISDLYPEFRTIRITTLACPGQLEIHLTSQLQRTRAMADGILLKAVSKIAERLKENIFSSRGEELEAVVGGLLKMRRETLAVAESCSGGFLGHRLTSIPGSSEYFLEGVITYSNRAKNRLLGVPVGMINRHGAVSAIVAERMAQGIKARARADYALAITGIAGPTGGTPEKPVGLVYTALVWKDGADVTKNLFLGGRDLVKFQSTQKALDMLRRRLIMKKERSGATRVKR
jgi:nicotinamide-nucleotide amidase